MGTAARQGAVAWMAVNPVTKEAIDASRVFPCAPSLAVACPTRAAASVGQTNTLEHAPLIMEARPTEP